MAAKIFLTGATGYVGGEVLYQISQLSAQHHIRCLVRSDDKAKLIQQAFPKVETIKGDLEDTTLIEQEAQKADIVLHLASTRHEPSSRAIINGLSNPTSRSPSKPGYWLQIGGASMFAGPEISSQTYGNPPSKTYDDITSISEILSIIKSTPSRVIDNLIITQDATKIRTALVPGPIIYGKGRGPGNTVTIQGPTIADYTIKTGSSFTVDKGENVWSTIHVSDVGKLFTLLVTAAATTSTSDHDNNIWNSNGIFFPENGNISFKTYATKISQAAHAQNLTPTDNPPNPLSATETNAILAHGAVVLGTNAKLSGSRARKYLGWEPTGISLEEEIPRMVAEQAERLKQQK